MPETRHVTIGELTLGNDRPLVLIAGRFCAGPTLEVEQLNGDGVGIRLK